MLSHSIGVIDGSCVMADIRAGRTTKPAEHGDTVLDHDHLKASLSASGKYPHR
jgi:hypothetical protein